MVKPVLQFIDEIPKKKSKKQIFWEDIRKELISRPNQLALVMTYNHHTLAYRERRDIHGGLNPVFPEIGKWIANVQKDEANPFYGPRSNKLTYHHHLYLMYRGD